ncbi:Acetyltransferase (GNAT) domain-containing protein [Roseivivax lentus]|uniref:Acetyltransferase (GNAT) domain-containing protein n=1 Tax=Roseivivax lentus TaxID=633194 RepID=A0A1N7Q5K4_9RHOB|nr:GNAT family N-acetyltransferase [Roseivivax lentus]SIT18170.1 Acetyltransferase (GNAT) domain-containing protein [Roseivivax lentus]
MSPISALHAHEDDISRVVSTLVTAFVDDPFIRWMFPEPQRYLAAFPLVLKYFAGAAFETGTAYKSEDIKSAVLWLPPGISPDEQGLGQVLEENIDAERQAQVFAVMEQVGAGHPEEAHWYLPAMGVDPRVQGRGYGAVLLGESLRKCKTTCKLAYLESTNPKNIPFYQRHGFDVIGEIQIDGSPVLTRMLRDSP